MLNILRDYEKKKEISTYLMLEEKKKSHISLAIFIIL